MNWNTSMFSVGQIVILSKRLSSFGFEPKDEKRYLLLMRSKKGWLALLLSQKTKLYPHMKRLSSISCLNYPSYVNCQKLYEIEENALQQSSFFRKECPCISCCNKKEINLLMYLVYIFQEKKVLKQNEIII